MARLADRPARPGLAARAAAPEQRVDPGEQLLQPERLHHVVVRAELEARDLVALLALGGEDEDREVGVLGADLAHHVEPAETGQHHVDEHEVWLLGPGEREARLAVHGGADDVPLHPEVQLQPTEDGGVVLDHQDPLRHHCTSATGSVIVNRAPFPTSLSTVTLPPWPETMCFTMARPSPVPSTARKRGCAPR